MERILVTGGAGYIGSHACKELARQGYEPVTLDNLGRGHRWAVKWGPLEHCDIADSEAVVSVINHYRPAAVLHFAGFGYVGESMQSPDIYYGNNVVGTWRLLQAMFAAGLKRLIFSSSCAVYGGMHSSAISEMAPLAPLSTYGRSKAMVEQMLGDYARAYGLSYVSLRYFNAAGADPDGELGEDHDPEPHIIPTIMGVAQGRQEKVLIYGGDFPTVDGTCVRDFIHVSDLARAHVLALRQLLGGGVSGAINLGNGAGYSLKQVLQAVEKVSGRLIPYEIIGRREGDPAYAVGDSTQARIHLGWQPRINSLDEIVSTAWRWANRDKAADVTAELS